MRPITSERRHAQTAVEFRQTDSLHTLECSAKRRLRIEADRNGYGTQWFLYRTEQFLGVLYANCQQVAIRRDTKHRRESVDQVVFRHPCNSAELIARQLREIF